MSQELQRVEQEAMGVQIAPEANLLAVVARAASDPTIDIDKMKALLDMQERLARRAAEVEFKAALSRIQPMMPRVNKSGRIEHNGRVISRFARYEDVDCAVRNLVADEGFAIDFDTERVDKDLKVILRVSHRAGHEERRQIVLPLDNSGAKNGVQGVGSTVSYGKRYLLCAFFNIVTVEEDNDGMGDTLSLDKQTVITDLLKETGANRAKFLEFMGASGVDAIPVSQYQRAVQALERKRR